MDKQNNTDRILIERYLAGDLSYEEEKTLFDLLEKNPELKKYLEFSEAVWRELDDLDKLEPSQDYVQRFWNRVSKEKEKSSIFSVFGFGALKHRWAFATSFATVLITGLFLANVYLFNNSINDTQEFVFNKEDELLLRNLDRAISKQTAASLEVFGPWED